MKTKVFISQPMNGKSNLKLKRERQEIEKDIIKKQCFVSIVSKINSINIGLIPKVIYLCTPFGMKELEGKGFEYIIDDLIKADLIEKVSDDNE